jgi:hypothetical protein
MERHQVRRQPLEDVPLKKPDPIRQAIQVGEAEDGKLNPVR